MTTVTIIKSVQAFSLDGIGRKIVKLTKGKPMEVYDSEAKHLIGCGLAYRGIGPEAKEQADADAKTKVENQQAAQAAADKAAEDAALALETSGVPGTIMGLGKDQIEAIGRDYGYEADKRNNLATLRNQLAEAVGNGYPKCVDVDKDEAVIVKELKAYYKEKFFFDFSIASLDKDSAGVCIAMGSHLKEIFNEEVKDA